MAKQLLNIGRDNTDPSFRYKMPALMTKVESGGNGIKTVIPNLSSVARSLKRPPSYVLKFFACELGTIAKIEEHLGRYIVNGKHDADLLQRTLNKFIERFVLCPKCRLPETDLIIDPKKRRIQRQCNACGELSEVDTTHKLCTFVFNNPTEVSRTVVRTGSGAAAAAAGAAADAEEDGEGIDGDFEAPPPVDLPDDDAGDWAAVTAEEQQQLQQQAAAAAILEGGPSDEDVDAAIAELKAVRLSQPVPAVAALVRRLVAERRMGAVMPGIMFDALLDEEPAAMCAQVAQYAPILSEYCRTAAARQLLLGCLERLCKRSEEAMKKVPFVLKALYDADVVDEPTLLHWHANPTREYVRKTVAEAVRKAAQPFIVWLQTAEEETDSEEESDSESGEAGSDGDGDGDGDEDEDEDEDDRSPGPAAGRAQPAQPAQPAAAAADVGDDEDLDVDAI